MKRNLDLFLSSSTSKNCWPLSLIISVTNSLWREVEGRKKGREYKQRQPPRKEKPQNNKSSSFFCSLFSAVVLISRVIIWDLDAMLNYVTKSQTKMTRDRYSSNLTLTQKRPKKRWIANNICILFFGCLFLCEDWKIYSDSEEWPMADNFPQKDASFYSWEVVNGLSLSCRCSHRWHKDSSAIGG